ncbi:MAG: hypothetical protein IJT73_10725 [Selenomonadaceae bacterium]|nr:hypothetical protein [Selenomonadaceae bacterium]
MKFLIYAVPIFGIIVFSVATVLNWLNYDNYVASGTSAPFSAFVVANVILYLVPAAVITVALIFIKRIFGS